MWDLPRPGLEPVSPALAGRLSTTAPPGKPHHHHSHHCSFSLACTLPQGNEISASLLPAPTASPLLMTLVHQGEFQVLPPTETDSLTRCFGGNAKGHRCSSFQRSQIANGLISLMVVVMNGHKPKFLPSYSNQMPSSPLSIPIPTEFYEFL